MNPEYVRNSNTDAHLCPDNPRKRGLLVSPRQRADGTPPDDICHGIHMNP